ncbi:MAG: YIEGIA family protein [Peptostreptococcales bacterium]
MEKEIGVTIVISLLMGMLARIYMMRVDTRQYPTHPQGIVSHLTLGLIASFLGAVALPALWEKEFSAVTFLALAAQQFRDVRNLERQSLDNIELTELVPRGTAYIEDIAKAFEARNYMVILTALFSSIAAYVARGFDSSIFVQGVVAVIVGYIVIIIMKLALRRTLIHEIADVIPAKIEFEGPLLTVNGVVIMNIGLENSRRIFLDKGIAIEIIPKNEDASATLGNTGQRQAIQHNASVQLGIRKDVDEPDFTPVARRNPDNGNVVMALIPMYEDVNLLVDVINNTPVLESAKRKTLISNRKGDEI